MTPAPPAPPRRVLYVVGADYWFLMSRLPMARAARKAGFEVHVATNVNKRGHEIEAEGFILHSIPLQRGGLSPVGAIPTVLAVRRILKKIEPDVMHHVGLQCSVHFLCYLVMARLAHAIRFRCEVVALTCLMTVRLAWALTLHCFGSSYGRGICSTLPGAALTMLST